MTTESFLLTNENIDHYVSLIREIGTKKNAESKMLTATCLTMEEILLNCQNRFGSEQRVQLRIRKRSGQLVILLDLAGEAYDPIEKDAVGISGFIIEGLNLTPHYSYSFGTNRVSLSLAVAEGRSELITIFLSVLLGALLGYAGKLLPQDGMALCMVVVNAISSAIFGLMSMASMPVIFLCVVYGILGSGSLQNFRENGLRILRKLMLSMLLMLLLATAVSLVVFGIRPAAAEADVSTFSTLIETLFSVVPDNIVAPFMNGDNIKVIALGVIFGCALLVSGEKVNTLNSISRQLKDVSSLVMTWVGKLIPVLIVVVLTGNMWSGEINMEILQLWKIVAVYLVCVLLILAATVLRTSRRLRLPVRAVISAILVPGMKGFVSASSMFCYSDMEESLRVKLKASESSINFGIPIGIAFYHPSLILYGVFLLYFAGSSGININAVWLVSFMLLCFVTSVAAPPVSGGGVSVIAILFTSLGVSDPRIAMAYPLYMLLDYPNTAFRVMMLILEVSEES